MDTIEEVQENIFSIDQMWMGNTKFASTYLLRYVGECL